jgi:predicted nuclease of predicted toxin-antitoxin system
VKLLLDEMISPAIAHELRARGYDVVAVENERLDLQSRRDRAVVRQMASERRVIVTNNVKDYRPIHDRFLAAGEEHYGLVFTFDDTMPRNKASIPLWVSTLEALLAAHPDDDALRNRVRPLP